MNMKIVLAGAASALLVGSIAVAQTTGAPANDPAQSSAMQPGATDTTTSSSAMGDQSATSAMDAGTDTAAQTGDASMAGERG